MRSRALAETQVETERIDRRHRERARTGRGAARRGRTRARSSRRVARARGLLAGEDRHALRAALDALNAATEEFAARRMNRSVAGALKGRRVDALG